MSGNLLWASLRDALAGAVLFMVLGFASIAPIHFVRPQDGRPLTDLADIFNGLADPSSRASYWWLAAMLFSTLLPTLAHGGLAVGSFFTLAPERWRRLIAQSLHDGAQGDAGAAMNGRILLSIGVTAAFCVPAFLLWYAFTLRHGVLDAAIAVFRLFAESIGAIPGV